MSSTTIVIGNRIGLQPNGATNEPLDLTSPNLPLHMALAALTGIAWYNVFELNIAVWMTFKRKRGLYFWSLLVCIHGIALHSVAFILKLYGVVRIYQITVTMFTLGWIMMVTGQGLVQYSRLHLLVNDPRIIRACLFMIIWNGVTMHLPTIIFAFGSHSSLAVHFTPGFRIMEKIQITVFCIQELAISAIYIWSTLRFLHPVCCRNNNIRNVMLQLLWINILIVIMDLGMLTMEFMGRYFIEAVMKGAVYSVKLKLEFAVLNQLVLIANASRKNHASLSEENMKVLRRERTASFTTTTSTTMTGTTITSTTLSSSSDDTLPHHNSSSQKSKSKSTRLRRWFKHFFPHPFPSAALEEPHHSYCFTPSILQTTEATRQTHQQKRKVYTSRRLVQSDSPPSTGIAMTTEIMQEFSTSNNSNSGTSTLEQQQQQLGRRRHRPNSLLRVNSTSEYDEDGRSLYYGYGGDGDSQVELLRVPASPDDGESMVRVPTPTWRPGEVLLPPPMIGGGSKPG